MTGERGAETGDVAQVKVQRPSDIFDIGVKRECGIEDDIQTLDLRLREDSVVVRQKCKSC